MTLNFSTALDARAAPDAGRVDQRVALAVALERHHDGVARRAGLIEGDHAILAEQPIDQGALADVGAADHRDLDAGHLGPVLRIGNEPASAASSSEITP
jgi:hypothetical protein